MFSKNTNYTIVGGVYEQDLKYFKVFLTIKRKYKQTMFGLEGKKEDITYLDRNKWIFNRIETYKLNHLDKFIVIT